MGAGCWGLKTAKSRSGQTAAEFVFFWKKRLDKQLTQKKASTESYEHFFFTEQGRKKYVIQRPAGYRGVRKGQDFCFFFVKDRPIGFPYILGAGEILLGI